MSEPADAVPRDSKADDFSEEDGLVAGEAGKQQMPSRVAESPKDLRYMAKKTWLFLSITTLLNIHNTIDGGTLRRNISSSPLALLTIALFTRNLFPLSTHSLLAHFS